MNSSAGPGLSRRGWGARRSAWNEHDEGHWIAPALSKYGGAEKLEAIKKAIERAKARREGYWSQFGGDHVFGTSAEKKY